MAGRADRAEAADRYGLLALALYLALSILFLGRALMGGHLCSAHIGNGPDPGTYMWYLVWWPYALSHRLNPFLTRALWAPGKFNLAWTTCVPLPSLSAAPLTAAFGPVVAFNVLCLLSPSLSAWCTFLLCRHVTRTYWPSILGGYIFGFSPYMMAQLTFGHVPLTLAFAVPLAIYLVLLRLDARISNASFIGLLALTLAAQFLCSNEIFATMTMFGAMVYFLGWSFAPKETSKRLAAMVVPVIGAYLLALFLLAPYLYYMLVYAMPVRIWSPQTYSANLLNFIIPTQANELGRIPLLESLSLPFRGASIAEADAYFGIPLIMIAALFARRHWSEPLGKTLIDSLVIICILSLGPELKIGDRLLCGLPGKLITRLPLLDKALPSRFPMTRFSILR